MALHCTGNRRGETEAPIGSVMWNRESATIRNSASALQTISFESADGPCLKNGGGVRSRVPKGMTGLCLCPFPVWGRVGVAASLAGEDRTQPFHAFQRDA